MATMTLLPPLIQTQEDRGRCGRDYSGRIGDVRVVNGLPKYRDSVASSRWRARR